MRVLAAPAPDATAEDLAYAEYQNQPWYGLLNYGYNFLWTLGQQAAKAFLAKELPAIAMQPSYPPDEGAANRRITMTGTVGVRVRKSGNSFAVSIPLNPRHLGASFFIYHPESKVAWDAATKAQKTRLTKLFNTTEAKSVFADVKLDTAEILKALEAYLPEDVTLDEVKVDLKRSGRVRMVSRAISQETLDTINQKPPNTTMFPEDFVRMYNLIAAHKPAFYLDFEIPDTVAKYIANSDTPSKADLGGFFSHNMSAVGAFGSQRWTDLSQSYTSSVENRAFDSTLIVSPLGKTNIGFLPKVSNDPIWVPPNTDAKLVDNAIASIYEDSHGEWSPVDVTKPEANLYESYVSKTAVIGADWAINQLLAINSRGSVESVHDLTGIQKSDAGKIYKFMRRDASVGTLASLYDISDDWSGFNRPEIAAIEGVSQGSTFNSKLITATQSEEFAEQKHPIGELRQKIAGKESFIYADIHPKSTVPTLASVFHFCEAVTKFIRSRTAEQLLKLHLNVTELGYIAQAMLITDNHDRVPAAADAAMKTIEENRALSKIDQIDPSKIDMTGIPFVSPDVKLMPHQVKGFAALKGNPKNAVLSVDAGGGKTLMYMLDIAQHIGKGLRLPLVLAPERLIKNYLNTSWLFGGRVNFVPLTSDAFYGNDTWGPARLKSLIENAPPNTIFFADFNLLTPRKNSVKATDIITVGTKSFDVHLPTAFLRQFKWGGVWIDESQTLKNLDAGVSGEVAAFINAIPLRREASGTYVHDGLHDVVGQFSLFDPSVFGDMSDFKENFYTSQGRSAAPAPGASVKVRDLMESSAAVVTLRRKEWASMLPTRQDFFWPVEMSPAQSAVYDLIIKHQEKELQKQMDEDPTLADLLTRADSDDPNSEDAQANAEKLDNLLRFYLQRMEQFLTAPGSDPFGKTLKGDDAITPKMKVIVSRCNEHFSKKYVGKILIWTQYIESANQVYENLPPELKKVAVHYTAARSNESMLAAQQDNMQIMVGCEHSMNTGEDLQMFSRIIRLETVWNWGTLEQGESRVNRPLMQDPRMVENGGNGIFYDWIFCDKSADVTKIARMVSKMVTTLKFYNRDNYAFQAIPTPPIMKLNRATLFKRQRYDSADGCMEHFNAYSDMAKLEQDDFDKFKADPKNNHKPFPMKDGGVVKGSAILEHVPYVPRMTMFNQSKVGLEPLYAYLQEISDTENHLTREVDTKWEGKGIRVHTEFGDGEIRFFNKGKTGNKTSLKVNLDDGSVVTCSILTTFVITDEKVKSVRTSLAKTLGMPVKKIAEAKPIVGEGAQDEPEEDDVPDEPVKPVKPGKKPAGKSNEDTDDSGGKKGRGPAPVEGKGMEMFIETYNGFLSLCLDSTDDDIKPNWKKLSRLGFIQVPDYIYSKVANWKQLDKWYDAIDAAEIVIPEEYAEQLENDISRWRTGRNLASFANGLAANQTRKFLQQEKRMLPKGQVTPYIVSHNHEIYLCLNMQVNRKTLAKIRSISSPGIRWKAMEGEVWKFCKNKADLQSTVAELEAGGLLVNADDVKAELRTARIRIPNQKLD